MPEPQADGASVPQASPAGRAPFGLHAHVCRVKKCAELASAGGLCVLHHQQHLAGIALEKRSYVPRVGPCLVDECERPRRSRGLCGAHYSSARRRTQCPACWGPMDIGSGTCDACNRAAVAAHLPTEKDCPQCERRLPVDAFGLRKSHGSAKWRSRCRECEAANSRLRNKNAQRRHSKDPGSASLSALRGYAKELGIPWAEVVERYPTDNRCEVCRRTPEEASPGGRFTRLSLDHCHVTGELRGFLCGQCNLGLGQLGDTLQRLQAAVRYLKRSAAERAFAQEKRQAQADLPPEADR